MKVILLELAGPAGCARRALQQHFDQCEVETLSRSDFFESGGAHHALLTLRRRRPDVFAVATERLEWQRGQNAFLLLGSLAGARATIIMDGNGGWREETRLQVFSSAPGRVAHETFRSGAILARSRGELRRLEREVRQRADHDPHVNESRPYRHTHPRITYLRATPGPGTQAGGAASHVKGVIEGLLELGADVHVVSNDALVGIDPAKIQLTKIDPEPLGTTRAVFDLNNNAVFTRGALPFVQQSPPDFIYQRYARFSWAGVVASLRSGRPLFLEYNGSEVWVGRHWDRVSNLDLLARYESLNLAAASRIFVVSEVERINLQRAGIAPEKIIVNPNGVDVDVFRPDVGGAQVRADLGLSERGTAGWFCWFVWSVAWSVGACGGNQD